VLAASDTLKPANADPSMLWMQSTVDGWVLPDAPFALYAAGKQARVPLLIGNNTREFAAPAEAASAIVTGLFAKDTGRALALYGFRNGEPPPDDPVLGSAGTQVVTDMAFRCPSNWVAAWQSAAGGKVWRYQFGVARPGSDGLVAHNAELNYVFDDMPANARPWPPVQAYWTNFIKTGNPNGAGLPAWPVTGKRAAYMAFMPEGEKAGTDLRGPICRLMREAQTNPEPN
jgi:para-nitrobenzyl esterase